MVSLRLLVATLALLPAPGAAGKRVRLWSKLVYHTSVTHKGIRLASPTLPSLFINCPCTQTRGIGSKKSGGKKKSYDVSLTVHLNVHVFVIE